MEDFNEETVFPRVQYSMNRIKDFYLKDQKMKAKVGKDALKCKDKKIKKNAVKMKKVKI